MSVSYDNLNRDLDGYLKGQVDTTSVLKDMFSNPADRKDVEKKANCIIERMTDVQSQVSLLTKLTRTVTSSQEGKGLRILEIIARVALKQLGSDTSGTNLYTFLKDLVDRPALLTEYPMLSRTIVDTAQGSLSKIESEAEPILRTLKSPQDKEKVLAAYCEISNVSSKDAELLASLVGKESRATGADIERIIKSYAQVPQEKRADWVEVNVTTFFGSSTDTSFKAKICEIVAPMPFDKLVSFAHSVGPMLQGVSGSGQKVSIVAGMAKISQEHWKTVKTVVDTISTPFYLDRIVHTLSTLPPEELNSFTNDVNRCVPESRNDEEIADNISNMALFTDDERKIVTAFIERRSVENPWQLLGTLRKVPQGQLSEVIKLVEPLTAFYMTRGDIASLINAVAALDQARRPSTLEQAKTMLDSIYSGKGRANFLQALATVSPGQEEALIESIQKHMNTTNAHLIDMFMINEVVQFAETYMRKELEQTQVLARLQEAITSRDVTKLPSVDLMNALLPLAVEGLDERDMQFASFFSGSFQAVSTLAKSRALPIEEDDLAKICFYASHRLQEAPFEERAAEHVKKEDAGLSHSLLLDFENASFSVLLKGLGPVQARGSGGKITSVIEVWQSKTARLAVQKVNLDSIKLSGDVNFERGLKYEKKYGEARSIALYIKQPKETSETESSEESEEYASSDESEDVEEIKQTGSVLKYTFVSDAYSNNLTDAIDALDEAQGHFSLDELRAIQTVVAKKLQEMHGDGVIYGDLKPENILCKEEGRGQYKLIDFEAAYSPDADEMPQHDTFYGNEEHTSPEVLMTNLSEPREYSTDERKAQEMFAFGILSLNLLSRVEGLSAVAEQAITIKEKFENEIMSSLSLSDEEKAQKSLTIYQHLDTYVKAWDALIESVEGDPELQPLHTALIMAYPDPTKRIDINTFVDQLLA